MEVLSLKSVPKEFKMELLKSLGLGVSEDGFVTKEGKPSIILQMGLALRQIENDPEKLEDLRQKIYGKFGTTELRIAELVKIGIVTQLLTYLVKIFRNPKDVESRLTSFLNQVDDLALFIKKDDLVEGKANLVMLRVDANPATMAIIFGTGNAKPVVLKILRRI